MPDRRKLILGAGAGLAFVGGAIALGAWRGRAPRDPRLPPPLSEMDWRLTDHRGRAVSAADWLGRPAMVFFGFTWCPDVSPTTLLDIAGWLEALGPDADRLTGALFSLDPERDSPPVLAEYDALVAPRII
ncbi:MAG: SCO family protein, partial [Pikeienuella sp.]